MKIELIGPDDDPQIQITLDLSEAYQVQAGCAPAIHSPDAFVAFEQGLFRTLKDSRRRALRLMQESSDA